MIHFRSSLDNSEHRVIFSPRPGTSQGAKEIQRQLLYGYQCNFCRNPVLFAFLTPEKVTLKRYEETKVVNGYQQFHMMIPGPHTDVETAYEIDWIPIPGQKMGLQRVYLKNHLIPSDQVGKCSAASQGGPRCCPYIGVHSMRADLLIRDAIIMGGFNSVELSEYELPDWSRFSEMIRAGGREFFIHGISADKAALPIVAARTDWITEGKGLAHWRQVLLPWNKATLAARRAEEEQAALASDNVENALEQEEQNDSIAEDDDLRSEWDEDEEDEDE